ncbi:MAG: hypothetical protein LBO68_03690 [Synergistaceae bacterium]|jgi:hypothetical protein|nr:hypothetical protein [Synergistaceae bacterium]
MFTFTHTRAQQILLAFLITATAAFALAASSPSPASAGVKREGSLYLVDGAEGYAPIKNGNKNEAREEAKREAYRDALEKALGATVTGITEMQNYQVVKDKVFSQTTGLVKSFDILREWEEDGVLYLSALCKVSYTALDGVLGPAVIDALGNPRIMVLIDERIEGAQGDAGVFISATESETLRVFEKAGYLLVDPDQAHTLLNIDPAMAFNDPSKLMDMARTLRADVIVLGKAYATSQSGKREGITLFKVKSTVQLKAVLTRTAYQVGSKTVERETGKKPALSVKEGAERCFSEAASVASKEIVHKIAYSLVSGSAGGAPGITVNIKIADISFKEVETLEEALRELAGKSGGVYEREYKGNVLEVDVVSEKTARAVASFLSEKGISVEGVTAQTISGRGVAAEDTRAVPTLSTPGVAVNVRITGVPSFGEATLIEDTLRELVGVSGQIEGAYKDNALEMQVTSDKTARNIAAFLSEKEIEIDSITSQSVSGSLKKGTKKGGVLW